MLPRMRSPLRTIAFAVLFPSFVSAFIPLPCFTRRLLVPSQHTLTRNIGNEGETASTPSTALFQVSTIPNPSTRSEESADEEHHEDSGDEFDMPWSDFQDWALKDNLPRYVVSIPTSKESQHQQTLYGLWRTMMREVTELGGYPIEMLRTMHARQLKRLDGNTTLSVIPNVLPLLDEFEFDASGGVSGRVYGVPGIADGSNIVTKEVADVQFTVPKGYVMTQEGAVAYELGTPLRESSSLDAYGSRARDLSSLVAGAAAELERGTVPNVPATQEDPDTMLVRLGVATAIVLGGATAISMLSHHLTVNVFWV